MPIKVITGAPGEGKSLRMLWEVEQRRVAENRDVYYSGVRDLLLPWTLFGADSVDPKQPHDTDASEWHKLPAGAIIVIDECQRLFRPRQLGGKVPESVAKLETHRHNGHDIYLVTQDPGLIDSNVRKLVGEHTHVMRKFGSQWTTLHTWKGIKENCAKSRKDSIEEQWRYPKEVFTWYKSAEVHTIKRKIPKKVIIFLCVPLVILLGVALAVYKVGKFGDSVVAGPQTTVKAGSADSSGLPISSRLKAPLDGAAYLAQFEPRIAGYPHTAHRFDDLTAPVRVPVPVGCVLYSENDGVGSFCITQQGTRYTPPLDVVRHFVERGMFQDFDAGPSVIQPSSVANRGGSSNASKAAP